MRRLKKSSIQPARVAAWCLAIALLSTGLAQAQGGTGTTVPPIVGGAPFLEAWVDPCNGQDGPASTFVAINGNGTPDQPFQTIGRAIAALRPWVGPNAQGIVHANPGVYSPGTNGESFPIIMRDFIHLQGVDARRVVIRGNQTQTPFQLFEPVVPSGNRFFHEALVDLTFLGDPQVEEMIDGFTFQGGHVQIYVETEGRVINARISNNLFDMLNFSDVGVPGPLFGILMVHTYDLAIPGYDDIPLNILNNTFIQAWSDPGLGLVTSVPGSVAITDVANTLANDPIFPFAVPDPNPILRGVGNPNIQNNLIRAAPNPARTALLGIDAADTTTAVATVIGPTNAFDPAQAVSTNGVFNSLILGAVPVPAVNTNPASGGTGPAFVGEMLSSLGGLPTGVTRDWRVLFDSAMVDAGSSPTPPNLTAGGILQAVNGTAYIEPALIPLSSFDFDGEVYGNLRRLGVETDIGFDETGNFVDSLYGNDSRVYSPAPCAAACAPTPGIGTRVLLFPTGGAVSFFESRTPIPYPGPFLTAGGYYWAFTTQFGTVVPPAPGFVWIQTVSDPFTTFSAGAGGVPLFPIAGYVPPFGGSVHNFAALVPPVPPLNACTYVNEQLLYAPIVGAPVLTNVQSAYD
ncbi:MAG: DUF1565 domain-containing protein [Acidobacteriota bacterium]